NVAVGEGFRAPALCDGWACAGAGARKPPKEETAGRTGPFGERDYGDLRVADGWRARRRLFSMATMGGSEAFASVEGGLATSRGHCARVPARGWRRRRSTVRGGMRGAGHEESILIRLGDGDR